MHSLPHAMTVIASCRAWHDAPPQAFSLGLYLDWTKKGRGIFSQTIREKRRENMDLPQPIRRVFCQCEGVLSERGWEWVKM